MERSILMIICLLCMAWNKPLLFIWNVVSLFMLLHCPCSLTWLFLLFLLSLLKIYHLPTHSLRYYKSILFLSFTLYIFFLYQLSPPISPHSIKTELCLFLSALLSFAQPSCICMNVYAMRSMTLLFGHLIEHIATYCVSLFQILQMSISPFVILVTKYQVDVKNLPLYLSLRSHLLLKLQDYTILPQAPSIVC